MPTTPRYQFYFLTILVVVAMMWLLLLTGFREYWGFWQSPEVYEFLKHEYPQWMRDYICSYYDANFYFVAFTYLGWLSNAVIDLRGAVSKGRWIRRLTVILALTAFMGMVVGVRGTNNLVGWLDSGRLHGVTPLQVQQR
ncbi:MULTISPECIES: hypothetical protein [unclassified Lentimonas]|uniref:hypothetical protein n=1 Tax=unclassified Lentimonas TaxID=2630993 RepID=UPI001389F2BC|nr:MULTISPECIES: hypothetical protein [unclassified Lentimonas]